MTTPEINQPLFQKIFDQITLKPATHNQSTFESLCGTTRCVAGWALHFHADDQNIHNTAARLLDEHESLLNNVNLGFFSAPAAHLLGLTDEEAQELFHDSGNDEARALVERYALKGRDDDET